MKKFVCFLLCSAMLCLTACGDTRGVPAEESSEFVSNIFEDITSDPEPAPAPSANEPVISLPVEEDSGAENLSNFMREIYGLMCDKQDAYLDGALNGTDGRYSYVVCEDTTNQWHPGVELISASFQAISSYRDFLDVCAFDTAKEAEDEIALRLDDAIVNRLLYVRDYDAEGLTYYVEGKIRGMTYIVSVDFVHDKYVVHIESEHTYTNEMLRDYGDNVNKYEETVILPLCVESVNTQLQDYGLGDWFSLDISMVAR